ncbi:MAG: vWA domain-containing protein [Polyangiaceae bacterium]
MSRSSFLRATASSLVLASVAFAVSACTVSSDSNIPADPGGSAPEPKINNVKPSARFARKDPNQETVRVTLLGLIDPVTQKPIPFKANETVYVTEDGVLKGTRVAQAQAENKLPIDIVFVVDNSGSMGEEADGVADKIVAFANVLSGSGVDARFGAVGYDGTVTGAVDLSNAVDLDAFLKREGRSGTSRTEGFEGKNADALRTASMPKGEDVVYSENGIVGIDFAERNFAWRPASQRIFVNFTDEPTQPDQKSPWTTKTFCARWRPENGTVHTVWSGRTKLAEGRWTEGEEENPEELSKCTPGAVVKEIKDDASDLDLTALPLTDALKNSALVEFVSADAAKKHDLSVVVKNGDTADGKTIFQAVAY